jgi:hypothetical protein
MEKRFQIFISSTFRDLFEERQSVLKAVLELNHMPAGMELFPAADESAWQLIKDVIDGSDYYVLIIAGRYGSLDEAGIGFTEKEYEYALKTGKPVIPLLHKNPDNLPREKTETAESTWTKLKTFRAKVEKNHTCVYWMTSEELKSKVIVGLTMIMKRHPAIGWVKADQIPSDATLSELLKLKTKISELETEAKESKMNPPVGTEEFNQGDDRYNVSCSFVSRKRGNTDRYSDYIDTNYRGSIEPSWNQIFAAIAPSMINETTDRILRLQFRKFFTDMGMKEFTKTKAFLRTELRNFEFVDSEIDTCIIQLRALGLIIESNKQRSVKDTETYWKITPYGDTLMVRLRAIRKKPLDDSAPATAENE